MAVQNITHQLQTQAVTTYTLTVNGVDYTSTNLLPIDSVNLIAGLNGVMLQNQVLANVIDVVTTLAEDLVEIYNLTEECLTLSLHISAVAVEPSQVIYQGVLIPETSLCGYNTPE